MAAGAPAGEPAGPLPWSRAWSSAIASFYPHPHGAAERHFPTAVTGGPEVAEAVLDRALPVLEPLVAGGITVTDVGAGDGTLLGQLRQAWPAAWRSRTRWRGVDLRARPAGVDPDVSWVRADATTLDLEPAPGLLVAHELLDDVPCEVLEVDDDGRLRVVLVDPATGHQALGPSLDDDAACIAIGIDAPSVRAWCTAWWPHRQPAARVECGLARDLAWRRLAGLVTDGLALAMDYGHVREERDAGAWDGGTLVGHRDGRVVSPVPDGTRNLTAHVAVDAVAAAVPGSRLVPPRDAHGARTPDGLWWIVRGTMAP